MKILFVCTGNTCRSPMAAALLAQALQERPGLKGEFQVYSAGLMALPDQPPSREAVEAMRLFDIDISGHRTRLLSSLLIGQSDLILTMTRLQCRHLADMYPEKKSSIFTLAEYAGQGDQDIEDPFGGGGAIYARSARQIRNLIEGLLKVLSETIDIR